VFLALKWKYRYHFLTKNGKAVCSTYRPPIIPKGGNYTTLHFFLRSALFWDIKRRRVVIIYRRFGTTYRSHLQGSRVQTLDPNIPEECWSHQHRGGSLKSRLVHIFLFRKHMSSAVWIVCLPSRRVGSCLCCITRSCAIMQPRQGDNKWAYWFSSLDLSVLRQQRQFHDRVQAHNFEEELFYNGYGNSSSAEQLVFRSKLFPYYASLPILTWFPYYVSLSHPDFIYVLCTLSLSDILNSTFSTLRKTFLA
jgi:hypothetical protein